MKTTIKTLAFGNRADIARTLAARGNELSATIVYNAIAPMLSNIMAGYSTFKTVFIAPDQKITKPTYSGNCPLCMAVAGFKGKRAVARDAAFSEVRKALDQADHDAMLEIVELTIISALAVTPSTKKPAAKKPDYESLYAGALITIAELEARVAELKACKIAFSSAPIPV